jgi:chemotaxis protein MotB
MSRKHKKHEEHENHERWLVSYADFITLLFAFFVVMYSMSSVNEGKYRVLSESMIAAFKSSARTLTPVQVGELSRSPHTPDINILDAPKPINFTPIVINQTNYGPANQSMNISENTWAMDAAAQQIDVIAAEVDDALQELVDRDMVEIRRSKLWLEIELRTSFLFSSGSSAPSIEAEVILSQLGKVLKEYPNQVHVEGYTDNKPIVSTVFPSNWELSSARAAAVVRLFALYGIQPQRMASVGYGEFRPITTNDTEAGRTRNRRVVIVILANLEDEAGEASVTNFELLKQKLESTPAQVN